MASSSFVVVMVVAMALVAVPPAASAITCGQVFSSLTPCINYLRAGGACPPSCCSGIKGLVSSAVSTQDRQTACGCLKTAAAGVSGLNLSRAAGLPALCRVNIPYKISPSTDCSRVR